MLNNNRYEIFCNEIVKGLNGTKAAIKAGFNEKRARITASELLKKDEIKNRISVLQKNRNKKFKISQEFVINELLWAMEVAKGNEQTYAKDKDGNFTKQHVTDLPSFIKIATIFAKRTGLMEIKKKKVKKQKQLKLVVSASRSPLLNNILDLMEEDKNTNQESIS